MSKTIDLAPDSEISFYEWHDVFGNFDWVAVNVDGVQEWLYDSSTPSTSWQLVTIDLDDYVGSVEIVFELYASTVVEKAGWYIDDVTITDVETEFVPEYDEEVCNIVLEPGEEADIIFPDWTPDSLAAGVSGSIEYTVIAEQYLIFDTNPANDILSKGITLDYWHDVGVKEVTPKRQLGILLEEDFDGTGVPAGWLNVDHDGDTYFWDCDWPLTPHGGAECAGSASWDSGSGPLNPDNWLITSAIDLSDQAATELSYWVAAQDPLFPSEHLEVWISTTGTTVPDDFIDQVDDYTETDDIWKERVVDLTAYAGDTIYIAFRHCESYDNYWIKIDDVKVTGMGGVPPPDVFIQPGNQAFAAVMENLGVFLETDLDANAKLYAFDETGVPYIIHEENYNDFDLEPLGGEETATFGSYNFVDHGIYQIDIDLPLILDDIPANNFESIGIAVDDTPPVSTHTVDPAIPDGDNGWYVSDVTLEFEANDGTEEWQSGADYVEYQINGGSWMHGDTVTVTADGQHTLKYRAVDEVGNVELEHSVDFKIDQAAPTVDLTWEQSGKDIIFTATCNDITSGMNRVEFYLEDALQSTAEIEPYQWTMTWDPNIQLTTKAIAFDNAGNSGEDELIDPYSQSQSLSQSQSKIVTPNVVQRTVTMPVHASPKSIGLVTTSDTEPEPEPELDVGRVWLRGLLFRCNRIGNVNYAMALRLHYVELTPTERTAGIVTMNNVVFKDSAYLGRMYEVGFGMFTYVFGFFEGGLEIN